MADNYLEKKMEEHRRGATKHYRPRVTPSGSRAGMLSLPFPVRRVIVSVAPEHECRECVLELRDMLVRDLVLTGCRVAFTHSDRVVGNRIAQSAGACAVTEGDLDTIIDRWEGIDVSIKIGIVEDEAICISIAPYADERRIRLVLNPGDLSMADAVRICLLSLVPGTDFLIGTTITPDTIISVGAVN